MPTTLGGLEGELAEVEEELEKIYAERLRRPPLSEPSHQGNELTWYSRALERRQSRLLELRRKPRLDRG